MPKKTISKPQRLTPKAFKTLQERKRQSGETAGRRSATPIKPDFLTPAEIERLRQRGKEMSSHARKAFAHLRQKKPAS